MVIELVQVDEARRRVLHALGLMNKCERLDEAEALAELIRRAASMSCPCPPSVLKQRLLVGLRGLIDDDVSIPELVEDGIDAVTAYGDLVELPSNEGEEMRLYLYTTPPGFVKMTAETAFLVGVAPDGQSLLPDNVASRIERKGFARRMHSEPGEDLPAVLRAFGLQEISDRLWFRQPIREEPEALQMRLEDRLSTNPVSGPIAGLVVLDSNRSPLYYKGRWTEPAQLSGRFVGRRPQMYGAPLWCYVELERGVPKLLLDFHSAEWRGCDQAWHLQMAIDACAGHPQQFAAMLRDDGSVEVGLFSPLPAWVQRRLDITCRRVAARRCLCAYEMSFDEYEAELPRLREELWLTERTDRI